MKKLTRISQLYILGLLASMGHLQATPLLRAVLVVVSEGALRTTPEALVEVKRLATEHRKLFNRLSPLSYKSPERSQLLDGTVVAGCRAETAALRALFTNKPVTPEEVHIALGERCLPPASMIEFLYIDTLNRFGEESAEHNIIRVKFAAHMFWKTLDAVRRKHWVDGIRHHHRKAFGKKALDDIPPFEKKLD